MSTTVVLILIALGFVGLVVTGSVALVRHHNRPPMT